MASRAAEKLRALLPEAQYAATGRHPTERRSWDWARPGSSLVELVAILPEIIAVVEAAENRVHADPSSVRSKIRADAANALTAALAALDEALGDDVT